MNGDQRMESTRAGVMDGARDEFFTGAAFAGDENRRVGGTYGYDGFEYFSHRTALADHIFGPRNFSNGLTQQDIFLSSALLGQRIFNDVCDFVWIERLGHVVIGAIFLRRDRGLQRRADAPRE